MDSKCRRGELRIYLGAAPGVGKTFAMLGEAHRRHERGTDVVVGLVETHGRAKTAALAEGLEVVPRKTVDYRGRVSGEMDVDAILARAPEVVVVDELAHTNVAGSRTAKRWQDIEILLDAGIDVLSTVNVQNLESLNDVVERITGVRRQETVPDEVVRGAEQVELVDITPEALRRRLAHGNVYPARRIDAALGNYFRPGNLTALRELALLWVADQVDVALRRYREDRDITDTWEARERVVVAVTGGPESETLIRRGRRIARRAGGELLVVQVLRGDGLAGVRPEAPAACRKLADDLSATFHTVVGDDVPTALLDFARGVNATQLVLGTSRRSRMARLLDEGIGATTVQLSGPIDVHLVTHDEPGSRLRAAYFPRTALARRRRILGWVLALCLPVIATSAGALLRGDLLLSTHLIDHLLAAVVVALVGGLGPALLALALSAALLAYIFIPPIYSFWIDAPENALALGSMVAVAVAFAVLVNRVSHRAELAARAGTEAALLASYSQTVLGHDRPLPRLLEKVRENFTLDSVALLENQAGKWVRVACAGDRPCDEPDEADTNVQVTEDVHLALRGHPLPARDRRVLEAAAGQALLALRHQRMAEQAQEAQRRAETTELRTALLSAIGHDLRTPLTSIKAVFGSLRAEDITLSEEDIGELLGAGEESADHLAALVDNLLDSSRLATGAISPILEPLGLDDIVGLALSGMDASVPVEVDVDPALPAVLADGGLLERVVANLVDNAVRHGRRAGTGTPMVAVRASVHADQVELHVVDHGPGLPKRTADSAFVPFQRLGDRNTTTGVGLGLSVAKGFIDAMGGTIRAEDTPGGGLTVVVSLPAAVRRSVATGHVKN